MKIIFNILIVFLLFGFSSSFASFNDQLAPFSAYDEVQIQEHIFAKLVKAGFSSEMEEYKKLAWVVQHWMSELLDVCDHKSISKEEFTDLVLVFVILNSSFFYYKKPTYKLDQMLRRAFVSIYGGYYDYREVRSKKDTGKLIYHGLYIWISGKSEDPVLFMKTFLRFILFVKEHTGLSIFAVYDLFEQLHSRFDVLLTLFDLLKEETLSDQEIEFDIILKNLDLETSEIFKEDYQTILFMKYKGSRILDQILYAA